MTYYVVDVTYSDGDVALYGPFVGSPMAKGVSAIAFTTTIRKGSRPVKDVKIRILNDPEKD